MFLPLKRTNLPFLMRLVFPQSPNFGPFGPKIDHQMTDFATLGQNRPFRAILPKIPPKIDVLALHSQFVSVKKQNTVHCDTVNFRRGNRSTPEKMSKFGHFGQILG